MSEEPLEYTDGTCWWEKLLKGMLGGGALGPVELLSRLVGRVSEDLAAFEKRMRNVELCRYFKKKPGQDAARGIPNVVFACAGSDEVCNSFYFLLLRAYVAQSCRHFSIALELFTPLEPVG